MKTKIVSYTLEKLPALTKTRRAKLKALATVPTAKLIPANLG
jgi:hypothetical protein